jgi:hypothetical protein
VEFLIFVFQKIIQALIVPLVSRRKVIEARIGHATLVRIDLNPGRLAMPILEVDAIDIVATDARHRLLRPGSQFLGNMQIAPGNLITTTTETTPAGP